MSRQLFDLHLLNSDRFQADYEALSELSKGLSGGYPLAHPVSKQIDLYNRFAN